MSGLNVSLDRAGQMMLAQLRVLLREEPPEANANMPLAMQDECAKVHAHWTNQVATFRLLLGVRLVNAALDAQPTNDADHNPREEADRGARAGERGASGTGSHGDAARPADRSTRAQGDA